ncbi:hypothetical protein VA249_45860 (plasmid) [Vibrio alfacsensis]|nr:hypothetical protein VA249_45860 [Vibrio alfacsensis]
MAMSISPMNKTVKSDVYEKPIYVNEIHSSIHQKDRFLALVSNGLGLNFVLLFVPNIQTISLI